VLIQAGIGEGAALELRTLVTWRAKSTKPLGRFGARVIAKNDCQRKADDQSLRKFAINSS
jgi:hypothetical protein